MPARMYRTFAGRVWPADPTDEPVAREDAEPHLDAAAREWTDANYDGPWQWQSYEVSENLTDADGAVLQWACAFEVVGEKPTTAPDWWWEWSPEDDE